MIASTFIGTPKINRGSFEPLEPIYERCLDIQQERQTKLAIKRTEKKKNEQ